MHESTGDSDPLSLSLSLNATNTHATRRTGSSWRMTGTVTFIIEIEVNLADLDRAGGFKQGKGQDALWMREQMKRYQN